MKKILISLLLFILSFNGLAFANTQIHSPNGFEGQLFGSTLALYGTKDGKSRFICTIEPFEKIKGGYHLVTAGHCVQMTPSGMTFSVADDIGGPLSPVTVMKAYMGSGFDFAEFEFKTTKKYYVFSFGDERNSHIGDMVINPNFALGVGKQIGVGAISSDILPSSDKCEIEDCAGTFLIQTFGAGGASGSAVLSAKTHKVIGIMIYGFYEQIGFGIEPISKFKEFLKMPNQIHPVSELD